MRVIHVASEMAPIAKVGGLADVLLGLVRYICEQDIHAEVILPHYGCIDMTVLDPTGQHDTFISRFDGVERSMHITFYRWHTLRVGLLDTDDGYWSSRKSIYGTHDELVSFLFFSMSVSFWLTTQHVDIVHMHDWQTALLPILLRKLQAPCRTILTVHNLEYQGLCQWHDVARIGLMAEEAAELYDERRSCCNLLRAGLLSASAITTVSPTYSREIMTQEGGQGLHEVLQSRSCEGIVNGLDEAYWNPATDPLLLENYHATDSFEQIIQTKMAHRQYCSEIFNVPLCAEKPLVVAITRLVPQKGVVLLRDVMYKAKELGMQCIVLGAVSDPSERPMYHKLAAYLQEQGLGTICLSSQEELAHRLFAAADIFVMPSLFEPCGLTQLIAMRYGALPVVRKTGGLADTVVDIDLGGSGVVFEAPETAAFEVAVARAIHWFHDVDCRQETVMRAMNRESSWKSSGQKYIALYERLMQQ